MDFKKLILVTAAIAVGIAGLAVTKTQAAGEIFIPSLVYRTGPYAPYGIPFANGFRDYYNLLNKRDGGINGVKVNHEECETKYNTKIGIECYEKLKGKGTTGAVIVNPNATGITYQLIPKAAVDKIPILSMGYGRTDAGDGTVHKWAFTAPTSYWSQATAFIKYVGDLEGGMGKLKGKKIALVYHNSTYGKEPLGTLRILSKKFGYDFKELAVDHPGQEQKSTWLQIRLYKPDYIFIWGWGVMNQVAIKEAAAINFPMDHFIGVWWSGSENDVIPAGSAAKGYKAATFHATGTDFGVHQDILKHIYDGDAEKAKENSWGEILYNRGMITAVYNTEAIRTAMEKFGDKPVNGEQVRWGLEHLNLTDAKLKGLGLDGYMNSHKITCEDHEGGGPVVFQQWTGSEWKIVSKWYKPMYDIVRAQIKKSATAYAKENNITPRDCSKEG
jgi:branched-chain amino acid transport system substrate-binding protein